MKLISYFFSLWFGLLFSFILILFLPLQWLGLKLLGYKGHKAVVDFMNFLLVKCLLLLGVSVKYTGEKDLPPATTLIFVSNHQGLFDTPPLSWHFRKHHPKFVSKIELRDGLPSISFNLRHGGSVLIDRSKKKEALSLLSTFGKTIRANNWSAIIFPEGTRSKNGKPKPFAQSGIKILAKRNPEALIVPVTINNSWKLFRYGKFPFGLGSTISIHTHAPIPIQSMPIDDLLVKVEAQIKNAIK